MPPQVRQGTVFVLSDVRSGSTLLDQCLGGHPQITSIGEVHWLKAYVRQDRSLYDPVHPLVCSCGQPLTTCRFWNGAQEVLGRPLDSLQLRPHFMNREPRKFVNARWWRTVRRFVESRPGAYRRAAIQRLCGGPQLARDSIDLYDAIAVNSNRPFCVDSSKSPYRFRPIFERDPGRTKAIVLARDYRAVVHSKMKRGLALEAAAIGWRERMIQISVLTRDLPAACVHRLTYEALCESPSRELGRICEFLGVNFSECMLQRPTGDIHHIGGSPSKFDSTRSNIVLDRSYENSFQPEVLARLRGLVGSVAEEWGYP
jgi:hypothetical protein